MAIDYQYFEYKAYEYLVRLSQMLEEIGGMTDFSPVYKDIADEQERIRTRKFRVAVVGEFKKGKSSFINALLGREILPVDALPTTATRNRITYGAVPKAYLKFKDGKNEYVDIGELAQYVTKLTKSAQEYAARIEEAVVEYPSIFCRNHVDLIDTPGINYDDDMNAVVLAQLQNIDLAIVTLAPGSPFSDTESLFMMRLLENEGVCQIIVVVTKVDEIRSESQRKKLYDLLAVRIPEKTLQKLHEFHEDGEPVFEKYERIFENLAIFGVSSLDALYARQHNDEKMFEKSGFADLNDKLPELILAAQNDHAVLRAVNTIGRAAQKCKHMIPAQIEACKNERDRIRNAKEEFASACYSLPANMFDKTRMKLFGCVNAFMNKQEELVRREFISCLSAIKVLDAELLDQKLQQQAADSLKNLNIRIKQELVPELTHVFIEDASDCFIELIAKLRCFNLLRIEGMEEVDIRLSESTLTDLSFSSAYLNGAFKWTGSPVPSKSHLMDIDLICQIQSAVRASMDSYSAERRKKIGQLLDNYCNKVTDMLEQIVVSAFHSANVREERLAICQDKLSNPDFLHRIEQLCEDNQKLREQFLNQMQGGKIT